MKRSRHRVPQGYGPGGGVYTGRGRLVRWRWTRGGSLLSQPIRCKREQWYLVRGRARSGESNGAVDLQAIFLDEEGAGVSRHLRLLPAGSAGPSGPPPTPARELLEWVQTTPEARHLGVNLPDEAADKLDRLTLHPIADPAPACHPSAQVPRWSNYRPPFPIETVFLPESLASLGDILPDVCIRWLGPVRSVKSLAARVRGGACVLDPQWPRRFGWSLNDLESLTAQPCRLIIDLQTLALSLRQARRAATEILTCRSRHDLMAARVTWAAVETRGFALEDVLPLSILTPAGGFATRALRATPSWKCYARRAGVAPLLSSETPWSSRCRDVLSAARTIGSGRLIATDLPWLLAGFHGPLLVPHLAAHLLRMHLAQPLDEAARYWNRWEDERIVLRDLADLARRYPPMHAVRWAAREGLAQLGLCVREPGPRPVRRHLMICTGRIDQAAPHDGVAPEAMAIFLQWLVREISENTPWARNLKETAVTWQFEAATGLRYIPAYSSAATLELPPPDAVLTVADTGPGAPTTIDRVAGTTRLRLDLSPGVCGDRSLLVQQELAQHLRLWIERHAAATSRPAPA